MGCCGSGAASAVSDDGEPSHAWQGAEAIEQDLRARFSSINLEPTLAPWDREASINLAAVQGYAQGLGAGTGVARQSSMGIERRTSVQGDQLAWTQSRKILEADLAVAQAAGTSPAAQAAAAQWGPSWASGEALLEQRLRQLNLTMHVVAGDGNCQFRSVSFCLYGTDRHHMAVRQRAVAYMRQARADFVGFLGEDFDAYVRQMSRSSVWGDELTLRAVSESYGAVISLVTSDPAAWVQRYVPLKCAPRRELFLTYIAPVHYNAIRRRKLPDELRGVLMRRHSRILRAVDEYAQLNVVPEHPAELAASAGVVH